MASRTPARVTFRWLLEVNKVATSGPEGKIRQVNAIEGGFGVTDMLMCFVWDDLTLVRWHQFNLH